MLNYPVVQLAYFVTDARAAAAHAARRFGAGPFYLAERIELAWAEHRGVEQTFLHTSAYGQWGTVMMELVQQDEEGPSPFRDMFAPGEEGLHHAAMIVDDLGAAYAAIAAEGLEVATRARTIGGTEFAFVDTVASLGHMLEIYAGEQGLRDFYAFVRTASAGWDGSDPVRLL